MKDNSLINYELDRGRSSDLVVRRLYSFEFPAALEEVRDRFFDIIELCTAFFKVSIFQIKVAGSAQTGYSFHQQKEFQRGKSDLDLAVIDAKIFESYLIAAQKKALPDGDTLESPRRTVFPTKQGQSLYSAFTENVAFHGLILPHLMPDCQEKTSLKQFCGRLSEKNIDLFDNINVAFYLSQHFFERKQQPNIGLYKQVKRSIV